MGEASPLGLKPDLSVSNACVDHRIIDEPGGIRYGADDHHIDELPRGVAHRVESGQERPEAGEILDPGTKLVVAAADQVYPVVEMLKLTASSSEVSQPNFSRARRARSTL